MDPAATPDPALTPTDPGHAPPEPLVPESPGAATLGTWFKENWVKLAVMAALVFVVCRFLQPLDVLLAVLGLGGIIFIHELGHFLAAKLCGVYVRTFSIGFGPALPFCAWKVGETTYKLGMIPLGGYVAMSGESSGETDKDEAADAHADDADPRSFKNKPVWQRLIIISAGVVMNVLLAAVCFVAAYLHGVRESPPVIGGVDPGGAAWRAGVRPGAVVESLNGMDAPWFDDIRTEVPNVAPGATVKLRTNYRGQSADREIAPVRAEGAAFAQLGITPVFGPTLAVTRRDPAPPIDAGSPVFVANEAAKAAGRPTLEPGDRIVGCTDPDSPTAAVTDLDPRWHGLPGPQFDLGRRMEKLAGKPVTLELVRYEQPDSAPRFRFDLPAAFRKDTGLRMKAGQVTAIRTGSAAEAAGVVAAKLDGDKTLAPGDELLDVKVPEADGGFTVYATDPATVPPAPNTKVRQLDPLRLPHDLNVWADRTGTAARRPVTVTVLRDGAPVVLPPMAWDDDFREELGPLSNTGTPVPVGGLGFAYRVSTTVQAVRPGSPAAAAGLQRGDVVKQVRYKTTTYKKDAKFAETETKPGGWDDLKPHQWAFADYKMQAQPPYEVDLRAERDGATLPQEFNLTGADANDPGDEWGVPAAGLIFLAERVEHKADGPAGALAMGGRRTMRTVKTIYQNLYGLIAGRISVKLMSGPITLARASYALAGEDVWALVLLLGVISVNLAVVNFLPVPMLDGGHAVFLVYEGIRGKPAPVALQTWLTWIGLGMVGCLMLFTLGLDLWRLFFGL